MRCLLNEERSTADVPDPGDSCDGPRCEATLYGGHSPHVAGSFIVRGLGDPERE